jgi:cell division protease FtsH
MLKDHWQRVLLLTILMLAINGLYVYLFPPAVREPVIQVAYSRFKDEVRLDHVAAVTIQGDVLTGRFTEPLATFYEDAAVDKPGEPRAYQRFRTNLPPIEDADLIPLLESHQVVFNVEPQEDPSALISLLASLLPWIIIFGVWWYIYQRTRQQGGLGGGLLSRFSKSGATLFFHKATSKTFQDVAGLEEAKQELQEVIAYLREPQKFSKLGGKMPKGILLVGPPGTGKTLMARAVAGEADVPFFSISASQFVEMFVGVGASRVRDLFTTAKENAPSIIFIDELDAVGRARGTGLGGGNDEREQTLNQMLSELDGFEPHDEVIVMAATNRPDVLDSALLRPGRFDRQVVIDRPDWRDRVKILEVHTRDVPLGEDVDLETIAKGTPGMVGADLQGLVNEAALIAAREDAEQVSMSYLEQEKRITAIHESGHALVARCLPNTDPIHKVTIIPRGQALGATQQLPEDDRYHYQRSVLLARLAVALGGRAAEKLSLGEYSTGAQNDLKQVMDLAEKMVCQWGMSEKLGPLSFGRGEEHPFLGLKLATEKTFSDKTAWIIDQEIEKLVHIAEEWAEQVLVENREVLEALVESLFDEETLDQKRLNEFFQNRTLQLPDKVSAALHTPD